jgi:hypothetical protein
MRVVRWIATALVALVLLVAGVAVAARFADGPLGPFPGGALRSGEWVEAPVADWSFARDVQEVELQLESQPSSRTTWILVKDGEAFVPCSLGFPPGKRWHFAATEDGRAVLRIEGRRYPVQLTRAEAEPGLAEPLRAEVSRKYGDPPPTDAGVWIFRVTSRPRSG